MQMKQFNTNLFFICYDGNFRNMNLLEVVGKPVDSSYCLIKIGGTAIVTTTGTKDIDLSSSIGDCFYTLDNIPVR